MSDRKESAEELKKPIADQAVSLAEPDDLSPDQLDTVAAGAPVGPTLDTAQYNTLVGDALSRIPTTAPDGSRTGGTSVRKPRPR